MTGIRMYVLLVDPIVVFLNLGITRGFARKRKLNKLEPSIYTDRLCAAVL